MDTVHIMVTKHLIGPFTRLATLEMLSTRVNKGSFLLLELYSRRIFESDENLPVAVSTINKGFFENRNVVFSSAHYRDTELSLHLPSKQLYLYESNGFSMQYRIAPFFKFYNINNIKK